MSILLSVYHRIPSWSRNLGASLRGHYLNRWRYDSNTERLVEQALERDFWTAEQWSEWKQARLSFILNRAATRVPYYRELWSRRRREGDNASWEYLENWPILDKQTLRQRSFDIVADDRQREKMFHEHTSGTTGTPLNLWSSKETLKLWYALFEARCRRWYGVSRRDRWAIIGGQLIAPVQKRKPPFWVWNSAMNQLYLSSYHLQPDLAGHYLDAIARYRVRYIYGYSSALYSLAQEILNQRRREAMDVVITNAEPLYDYQRETIAEAFGCPVRETYGMAEIVAAASECEHGRMHQWPEAGVIELDGSSRTGNAPRDLICTGFLNPDMPLIRYRLGDSGTFSNEKCGCGRNLPLINRIEGRTDDILYTSDGRRVGRLDPVFKAELNIREAQIIQRSLRTIIVKYIPADNFDQKTVGKLRDGLRERMGDVDVVLEEVTEIPRTARGKFRAVVCELPSAEREAVSKQ